MDCVLMRGQRFGLILFANLQRTCPSFNHSITVASPLFSPVTSSIQFETSFSKLPEKGAGDADRDLVGALGAARLFVGAPFPFPFWGDAAVSVRGDGGEAAVLLRGEGGASGPFPFPFPFWGDVPVSVRGERGAGDRDAFRSLDPPFAASKFLPGGEGDRFLPGGEGEGTRLGGAAAAVTTSFGTGDGAGTALLQNHFPFSSPQKSMNCFSV
mmetsp:Transcript_46071/g.72811  ORF Transcript_46071/g.72811 Transcript_46071/m.72811 type:complete len:212 (-) Transcript_46071:218-853(-)|eukprot:CAMPEP_0169293940 /NCGR_PEP_ID=MMETSP1016-20121227/63586_1 /TAXON_ID=342587 /ORGANISM="Karlodinium micrum, Strain CCMP2283" /LENGTH=211 /DNA_ID=CAMNT_0009384721 /DNA_START=413 /DNA_END=1048 /DNA_ORIENTATION=+